ncbi:MAG TPA: hypothetical protein ACQGQI_08425, partial [Xylella sp.]
LDKAIQPSPVSIFLSNAGMRDTSFLVASRNIDIDKDIQHDITHTNDLLVIAIIKHLIHLTNWTIQARCHLDIDHLHLGAPICCTSNRLSGSSSMFTRYNTEMADVHTLLIQRALIVE